MGRGTGFHANQARRLFLEEGQHLRAAQLAADNHRAQTINAMDLKNVLRKIYTDCDNFVHGQLLFPCGSDEPPFWHNVMPSGGSRPLHQKRTSDEEVDVDFTTDLTFERML
jgi:hypothetical protein